MTITKKYTIEQHTKSGEKEAGMIERMTIAGKKKKKRTKFLKSILVVTTDGKM